MLDDLVDSKASILPKLEEIKFDFFHPVARDLKQACHEVEVELVLTMTSQLKPSLRVTIW